jgi:hypothetical protein
MSSSPQSFDWHAFVTIRESNPTYHADIEAILDRIAQTPDGQELIKKAWEVSGSGKNKVEIATSHTNFTFRGEPFKKHNWGTTGAADFLGEKDNYEGKLTIDLSKAGSVGYVAPDGKTVVPVSQTNTLVHEMFHLGDPKMLPHVRDPLYREALRHELAKLIHVQDVDTETTNRILDKAADNVMRDVGLTMTLETDKIFTPSMLKDLQTVACDHDHGACNHTISIKEPQGVLFSKLRGSVVGNDQYPAPPEGHKAIHPFPNGGWRHEEQCVKYVDRFMLEYFGEPPRQGYGNLVEIPRGTSPPPEPELLPNPMSENQLPDYQPDSVPSAPKNLPKPLTFVQKLSSESLQRGVHLSNFP